MVAGKAVIGLVHAVEILDISEVYDCVDHVFQRCADRLLYICQILQRLYRVCVDGRLGYTCLQVPTDEARGKARLPAIIARLSESVVAFAQKSMLCWTFLVKNFMFLCTKQHSGLGNPRPDTVMDVSHRMKLRGNRQRPIPTYKVKPVLKALRVLVCLEGCEV